LSTCGQRDALRALLPTVSDFFSSRSLQTPDMAKFVRVRTKLVVMSGGCRRVDIVSGCKLDIDLCAHVDISLWTSCPDVNFVSTCAQSWCPECQESEEIGVWKPFTSVRFFWNLFPRVNMGGKICANSVPPPFFF